MKKSFLPVVVTAGILSSVLVPGFGTALTEVQRIQQEIRAIEKKAAELERKEAETANTINKLNQEISKENEEIELLFDQIDLISSKIAKLNEQLDILNEQLEENEQQKLEAEARVETRDQLLRSRVRLMYMNGVVSYLDVLFSATSFGDFLDRFNALKSIIGQDKEILEANQRDRDLIVAKGLEIAEQRAEQQRIMAQEEETRVQLVAKEKQKQVRIASLSQQIESHESYNEEVEKEMMAIARQAAAKQKELRKAQEEEARKKGNGGTKPTVAFSGGQMAYPLERNAPMTSDFGSRTDPISGKKGASHSGIDFGAPRGTSILAAEEGYVILASEWSGYGNTVIIDHGNNVWTLYAHIRENGIKVKKGDYVKRGQKIAEVGNTGRSTGNHLHFEVRINEKPVDPKPYIR